MEKSYSDYAYHLRLAVQWARRREKDKRAEQYHAAHLRLANKILEEFKPKYR